jgi:hypothetical protein
MSFSSEEVNYLVYRYLEESGFHHSAYLFGTECNVFSSAIDGSLLPRGALIAIIQKGIFYAEAELCSLLPETELDGKFEKAIGSLSLLDAVMPETYQRKAYEVKVKDEVLLSTTEPTTAPGPATTSETSISIASSIATTSSYNAAINAVPSIQTNGSPLNPIQIAREREFRAQQSAANMAVNNGIPARGNYRTMHTTVPSTSTTNVTANNTGIPPSSGAHLSHLSVPSVSPLPPHSSVVTNGMIGSPKIAHAYPDRDREMRESNAANVAAGVPTSRVNFAGHSAKLKAIQHQHQQSSGSVIYGAHT